MQFFLSVLFLALTAAARPLAFEENKGQTTPSIQFFVPRSSSNVLVTAQGLRFVAPGQDLTISFPGAAPLHWVPSGLQPQRTYYQREKQNIPDVRHFSRLTASHVYPGIDLTLYFQGSHLEYDFIIHPHADPSRIQLHFSQPLHQGPQDSFTWQDNTFRLHQNPPLVYQQSPQHPIPSRWLALDAKTYCFAPGPYHPHQTLILDPVLEFSALLGGEADEEIVALGDGWVAGHTRSNYFPAFPGQPRANRDIFLRFVPSIANLPPNAATLNYPHVHRTYIFGGSGDDTLSLLTTSATNTFISAFLVGTTSSPDLPMQRPEGNAYRGGASDAFVANLTVNTPSPGVPAQAVYTGFYFGGSGEDRATSGYFTGFGHVLGGTTDSPDLPVANAPQSQLAGGKDAFLAYLPQGRPQNSLFVTYLGGEADDAALDLQPGFGTILLAGESRSANWPLLPGERQGPSDAFFFVFNLPTAPTGTLPAPPDLRTALRLGGSGEDRITSLARSNSYLALGGESTSPDLPLRDAPQANLAGGRDAFYALYDLATLENKLLSYYGGSGDETLRRVVLNADYDLAIAGSTTSSDLPLREALQSNLSGPSDAFFAYIGSTTRALELSSYLGGSGDDTIHAIQIITSSDAPLRLAGSTTSPDFPVLSPLAGAHNGSSEGFYAALSLPILFVQESLWAAPKVTNAAFVYPQNAAQPLTLTARIEDPSLAQIRLGDRRYSELTLPLGLDLPIEGLAESGETALLLSAPGYTSRRVRIRLGRSVVSVPNLPTEISLFAGPQSLRATVQILDTATNTLYPAGRALDFNELSTSWTLSDPNIASILTPSLGTYRLNPLSLGSTTLSVASAYPFWPEGGLPLNIVAPRFSLTPNPVFLNPIADLSVTLSVASPLLPAVFPVDGYRISGRFRLESEDPSLVLISAGSNNFTGALDIDLSATPARFFNFQLRALASSGRTRIRVSSPSLAEDFFLNVELSRLLATPGIATAQSTRLPSTQLTPSSELFLGATFSLEATPTQTLNFGTPREPLSLRVLSSNPQVLAPPAEAWRLSASTSALALRTTAVPGTTDLSFATDSPHLTIQGSARVTTDPNLPVNFGVSEIIVGQRLVAPTTFTSPGPQPQPLEIEASIEDPSLATIALSASGTPAASQRLNASGSFGFWVHGLASSGATTLRLRITGRPDLRIPIKLYPSAVAFTADAISLAANATLPSLSLASYALDPTTLLPLLQQPLIPGQRIELSINSLSPDLSLERPQCAFTAANFSPLDTQFCATSLSWTKPGSYTLELNPPSGFTIPRARHSLRVLINPARPNFFLPEAVGDALYRSQVNTIPQNQVRLPYTLISLNPELLLFSSSAEAPPQARLDLKTAF